MFNKKIFVIPLPPILIQSRLKTVNMIEKIFFEDLLTETGKIFQTSDIKKYQSQKNKNWNYAVCETPIKKGKGLIFGLNWGGDNISTQSEYPLTDNERNWNFMNNSKKYFTKYLEINNIEDVNYSNLCFFRSPKIKYLTKRDWEISIPLFKRYTDFIKPSWTIMLGKTGIPILNQTGHLKELIQIEINGKRKRTFGYRGILFNEYPFYCVPHPQARIASDVRGKVWMNLFKQKS